MGRIAFLSFVYPLFQASTVPALILVVRLASHCWRALVVVVALVVKAPGALVVLSESRLEALKEAKAPNCTFETRACEHVCT